MSQITKIAVSHRPPSSPKAALSPGLSFWQRFKLGLTTAIVVLVVVATLIAALVLGLIIVAIVCAVLIATAAAILIKMTLQRRRFPDPPSK